MALEVLPERFLCEEGGRDESPPARRRREKKASRELKIDAFAADYEQQFPWVAPAPPSAEIISRG